jgi:hypothetical protein
MTWSASTSTTRIQVIVSEMASPGAILKVPAAVALLLLSCLPAIMQPPSAPAGQ